MNLQLIEKILVLAAATATIISATIVCKQELEAASQTESEVIRPCLSTPSQPAPVGTSSPG